MGTKIFSVQATPVPQERGRNVEPFDASIIGFLDVNEHSTSYFSGVSGVETVFAEVVKVNPRERMKFASNSVFSETPKFVDVVLLPTHTADKLKSIFTPATRAGGLADKSDGLTFSHGIAEVKVNRVSETKAYSEYI